MTLNSCCCQPKEHNEIGALILNILIDTFSGLFIYVWEVAG